MILTGGVKRERCRLHISHERVNEAMMMYHVGQWACKSP